MIHVIVPPSTRSQACPFVQRTASVLRILELLKEQHARHEHSEQFKVKRGDLVFYSYPDGKQTIAKETIPIECGVGYTAPPWGAWRVYESEAWRHFNFGAHPIGLEHRRKSWVIPWAFDPLDWSLGTGAGRYVSHMGRLSSDKGISTLFQVARARPSMTFKIASEDPPIVDKPTNVEFVGPIYGRARAEFLGQAAAHLCPTEYVEPLGGTAIEAMLCGTPTIASNFGGFTETVVDGVSGWLCSSVNEMIESVDAAVKLPKKARAEIRAVTIERFSIEAVLPKWRKALPQMRALPLAQ